MPVDMNLGDGEQPKEQTPLPPSFVIPNDVSTIFVFSSFVIPNDVNTIFVFFSHHDNEIESKVTMNTVIYSIIQSNYRIGSLLNHLAKDSKVLSRLSNIRNTPQAYLCLKVYRSGVKIQLKNIRVIYLLYTLDNDFISGSAD